MQRPKFSLRTLFVLVTLLAVLLGAGLEWRRRTLLFIKLARRHDGIARANGRAAWEIQRDSLGGSLSESDTLALAAKFQIVCERHSECAKFYRNHAWFPFWEPPDELLEGS